MKAPAAPTLGPLEQQSSALADGPAWRQLAAHAGTVADISIATLLAEPSRFADCSLRTDGLFLDYSRHRLTPETIKLLVALAEERRVPAWIEALFRGAPVNTTEDRPALHVALRMQDDASLPLPDGTDAARLASAERKRFLDLAEQVRAGGWLGVTGKPIRHVVNIGIGGSDLGPVMAVQALRPFVTPVLQFHFVSNVDGTQLADVLASVAPEETLFIICSKSFTTLETAVNAESARAWLAGRLGVAAISKHFVAISVNEAAMDRFGISAEHRFRIWDWVGGRYSLWSAVGLAIAIAIGPEQFNVMLAGARRMDEHFRTAPLTKNLPVLMALLGVWNQNFQGTASHAVLPYDGRLQRFPAYLQQLEMESNGKSVTRDGRPIAWPTGTIIWGEPGNNAQHSFFQLLHQGTARFSADFIAPIHGSSPFAEQHRQGLANMLAQAEAFARGYPAANVRSDLLARDLPPAEVERLVPHKVHPGNHPSSILLFDQLDPQHLGSLVALYEHKVFVQACIWGINPFDQWGVELGKQMASAIYAKLQGPGEPTDLPGIASTIRRWTGAV